MTTKNKELVIEIFKSGVVSPFEIQKKTKLNILFIKKTINGISKIPKWEYRKNLIEPYTSTGMPLKEISTVVNVPIRSLYHWCRHLGINIKLLRTTNRGLCPKWQVRKDEIQTMFDAGGTLDSIGVHFGVTRERMRQVCNALEIKRKMYDK